MLNPTVPITGRPELICSGHTDLPLKNTESSSKTTVIVIAVTAAADIMVYFICKTGAVRDGTFVASAVDTVLF